MCYDQNDTMKRLNRPRVIQGNPSARVGKTLPSGGSRRHRSRGLVYDRGIDWVMEFGYAISLVDKVLGLIKISSMLSTQRGHEFFT